MAQCCAFDRPKYRVSVITVGVTVFGKGNERWERAGREEISREQRARRGNTSLQDLGAASCHPAASWGRCGGGATGCTPRGQHWKRHFGFLLVSLGQGSVPEAASAYGVRTHGRAQWEAGHRQGCSLRTSSASLLHFLLLTH